MRQILVIDDDELFVSSLNLALARSSEVALETTTEPAEGLKWIISGRKFDAIICDQSMPKMSGFEFFNRLRIEAPDQAKRVLFISGAAPTKEVKELIASSAVHWLDKPFANKDLVAKLQQIIALE